MCTRIYAEQILLKVALLLFLTLANCKYKEQISRIQHESLLSLYSFMFKMQFQALDDLKQTRLAPGYRQTEIYWKCYTFHTDTSLYAVL